MPDVFAWPPVFITGFEHTKSRPVQRSEGLSGTPSFSQSEPTRRLVSAKVTGIGVTRDGGAYVEALKELMDGKPPFVRMTLLPRMWFRTAARIGLTRGRFAVDFKSDNESVNFIADGQAVNWTRGARVDGLAAADDWPYLDCTGFAAGAVAVYPMEQVTVGGQTATALRTVTANSDGTARIYLMSALPSGEVRIGVPQTAAFEIRDYPRSAQSVRGGFSYDFNLREVFAEEFADGFTEIDPWS